MSAASDSTRLRQNLARNMAKPPKSVPLPDPAKKPKKSGFFGEILSKVREKVVLTVLGGVLTLLVMDLGRREIRAYDENLNETRAAIAAVREEYAEIRQTANALNLGRRGHMQNLYNHWKGSDFERWMQRYERYETDIADWGAAMADVDRSIRSFAQCTARARGEDPIFSEEQRENLLVRMKAAERASRDRFKDRVSLSPPIPTRQWAYIAKDANFCPSNLMTGRVAPFDGGKNADDPDDKGRMLTGREGLQSAHYFYRRFNDGPFMQCVRDFQEFRDDMAGACFRADTLSERTACLKEVRANFTADRFCAAEDIQDLRASETELLDADMRWIAGEVILRASVRPNAMNACEATLGGWPRRFGHTCEKLLAEGA